MVLGSLETAKDASTSGCCTRIFYVAYGTDKFISSPVSSVHLPSCPTSPSAASRSHAGPSAAPSLSSIARRWQGLRRRQCLRSKRQRKQLTPCQPRAAL